GTFPNRFMAERKSGLSSISAISNIPHTHVELNWKGPVMKTALAITLIWLFCSSANAEYRKIDMTVFGMDCAPCAHAIHVSMKGIPGVNTVDVDLNTGLVKVSLTPGNTAGMGLFQDAVKKNGFTYK